MSKILVNNLSVRNGPSTSAEKIAYFDAGEIIKTGNLLILNEGRIWLRYIASSGKERYICVIDNEGSKFIDIPKNIPGPRNLDDIENDPVSQSDPNSEWKLTAFCPCFICRKKTDDITASGYKLKNSDHLQICAAPENFPFHTVIHISGGWVGTVKVEERGGCSNSKILDIFCKNHEEVFQFGVKKHCIINY